jgi:hypothetical protein
MLFIKEDLIHERLVGLSRKEREAAQRAELEEISLSGAGRGWEAASAVAQARSAQANAHSALELRHIDEETSAREMRRAEAQVVVGPMWARVRKWEQDEKSELMAKAAKGLGGAAFVSGAMAMMHGSAMMVGAGLSVAYGEGSAKPSDCRQYKTLEARVRGGSGRRRAEDGGERSRIPLTAVQLYTRIIVDPPKNRTDGNVLLRL